MIGRKRTLTLPDRRELETPLLVPSVSSAKYDILKVEGKDRSHAAIQLHALRAEFTQTLLISALDLNRELLFESEDLLSGARDTLFHEPRLLILDSGCYEERDPTKWSREDHDALIARLPDPDTINIALVNFDERTPYDEQIAAAQDQLGAHDDRLKVCLLKPPDGARDHNLEALSAHVRKLAFADIVGIAEKDLGDTLGDRLRNVARIRRQMDEANLAETPLHLFGALDPVLSPFYFAAGADIFDGLTWLNYAYHQGLGSYGEAVSVIECDLAHSTEVRRLHRCRGNLVLLRNVQDKMRLLAAESDWADLGTHGEQIRQAWRQASS